MSYSDVPFVVGRYKPIQTMMGTNTHQVTSSDISCFYIGPSDGIIDSYLANRYVIPITPVPTIITMISADLSIHSLLAEKANSVPEFIQARYDRCMSLLKELADGTLTLPGSAAQVVAGDNYVYSRGMDYHPVFSPVLDDIDQKVDDDLVEADKTTREDDPC